MSDEHAFNHMERDFAGFIRAMATRCLDQFPKSPESPIERMMFIGIYGFSIATPRYAFAGTTTMVDDSKRWPTFHLETQAQVGAYRADFLIRITWDGNEVGRVVIECDGHDFHERTKDQAARDRARDREMQASGHVVLRFTGSEIYRDLSKCAAEVNEMCWSIFHKASDKK